LIHAERIHKAWLMGSLKGALASFVLIIAAAMVIAVPSLSVSAAAIIGSATVVLSLLNPLFGLGALILSVPFSSFGQFTAGGFEVTSTELITGLLLFVWLARGVRQRQLRIKPGPLAVPILFFIGLVLMSVTYSPSLVLGLKELLKWLELLAVYLFVVNNVTSSRQVKIILVVLLAAATAEAAIGYYQFFARVGPDSFRIGSFLRAYGTFGQPNPFAGYLGSVAVLALSLWLVPLARRQNAAPLSLLRKDSTSPRSPSLFEKESVRVRDWPEGPAVCPLPLSEAAGATITRRMGARNQLPSGWRAPDISWWLVLLSLGSFGFISIAIFMSMSRGAWLGLAAGMAVVGALSSRRTLMALVALVLLLSLVLLAGSFNVLPAQVTGRITQLTDYFRLFDASRVQAGPENWAMVERMANWQAAWGMYERYPWFGVGVGNFAVAYPEFALEQWQEPKGHAHNVYLNTLAEMGVVGLGGYLIMLAAFFFHTGHTVWRTRADPQNLAAQANSCDYTCNYSSRTLQVTREPLWRRLQPAPTMVESLFTTETRSCEAVHHAWLYAAVAIGALGMLAGISVHNLFDSLFVHGMNTHIALVLGLVAVVGQLSKGQIKNAPAGHVTSATVSKSRGNEAKGVGRNYRSG